MRRLIYLKDVVTLQLNTEKCNGCRMCIKVCPHEVFAYNDKKVQIIDRNFCMECGACALNCPESAIYVKSGVGCATAVIAGTLGRTEPTCGCSSGKTTCSN